MINVAIIGFGLSGRYLQAPFFATNPRFSLKTIVTNNQNPQEIFPSVKKASSIDEVLADDSIDLVSIAAPHDTHYMYAKKCLLAGKHILVEKPFTPTAAEGAEIVELAESCKKHVFIFQNRRFDSDFLTVKDIIEQGFLGKILRFEAHYNRFKPILNPKKWKETVSPSSGIIYDLGAHILDQSIALFGNPQSVWGQTFTQREGSEIDDAFEMRLDYGTLKVALSSSLMVREETPRYIIHGTKGSFIKYGIDVQEDHLKAGLLPNMPEFGLEPAENQGILNTEINGISVRGKVETKQGSWRLLFDNIADVILENKEPIIKSEQVLEQLRIIEQVKM